MLVNIRMAHTLVTMKTEHPTTSEQKVLNKLRKKILERELPVGEFLSQRKLAEETKTSVISVRGALRQLENDGLIENIPRWGVRIPKETPEIIKDRYRIRELFETHVVECLCRKLSPVQQDALLKQAAELDKLAEQTSAESAFKFARLHHDFHLYLADCCESPLLTKFLERVINASLMVLNAKRMREKPITSDLIGTTHTELVEIIITGPTKKAVESMRTHIHNGLKSELEATSE